MNEKEFSHGWLHPNLHRQLLEALRKDEQTAGTRLSTPFIAGYLYAFIRVGFVHQGFDGDLIDKYLKRICNNVLPYRLYEIFNKQLAMLELAKQLGKLKVEKEFEMGTDVGAYDAGIFGLLYKVEATNMYYYLTNGQLDYKSVLIDSNQVLE